MSHQYATLEDSVYFGFVSNDTSGSAVDGTSPLFDVRLGGAAAGAAPVLSGTPTLLTSASYGPGAYEVAVAATAANGFAAGNTYLVFVTVTADAQTPGSCLGSFTLGLVPADAVNIAGVVPGSATIGTTTTNTDMRGTDSAALASNYTATRAGYLDNINGHTAQTGDSFARIGAAGASLTAINLPNQTMDITGNLSGSVGSVTGAVGSVTGAVGSVTGAVGSVAGNVDGNVTGSVGSVTGHTNQTGDTYALANGAAGFVAIDTVVDAIKVVTDALSATGAANLALSAGSMIPFTVTGTPTSTEIAATGLTALTGGDDVLIGRIVVMTSGNAIYEAARITDYVDATGAMTVTTLAVTPAATDTGIVI